MKGKAPSRTPSLYGTVTQRVLIIPELLESIFSFCDTNDNASNAAVCRAWSEVALDILWKEVVDLPRMFHLLAPTEQCPQGRRFSRPLEPNDWTRFNRYASRVRTLIVTTSIDEYLAGPDVFDEIAQTRTTHNLFPKLSALFWHPRTRLRRSLMFMHENIKRFTATLAVADSYPLSVYLQEIALRMPRITHLDLRFTFSVRDIERSLCDLLAKLPHLKSVIMPKFTLTTDVMQTLSRKEQLGVVQFEWLETQGGGDVADVQNWAPLLEEGAFPALYDLNLNVQLPPMLRFMATPFFPFNIRILYIHLTHMAPPQQVHEFLSAVGDKCQRLTSLYLDYAGDPFPYVFRSAIPYDEFLTWDTIRPILNCPKLTKFELHWESPLTISQSNIEQLASSWPALESLMLVFDPLPYPQPTPLTLEALVPFARHCPRLRELGLHVAANSASQRALYDPSAPTHSFGPTKTLARFQSLELLSFGTSSIEDPEPVALFLSQLCPAQCRITAGANWQCATETPDDEDLGAQLSTEQEKWYGRWEQVNRVLPLLVGVREEEWARRTALEREVGDLRVRCQVLEERLNMGAGAISDSGCLLL